MVVGPSARGWSRPTGFCSAGSACSLSSESQWIDRTGENSGRRKRMLLSMLKSRLSMKPLPVLPNDEGEEAEAGEVTLTAGPFPDCSRLLVILNVSVSSEAGESEVPLAEFSPLRFMNASWLSLSASMPSGSDETLMFKF
eukprot:844350-Rhodomonas_salina.1